MPAGCWPDHVGEENRDGGRTIRQRADGRWESVVHVGWENGRRIRKSFYGRTRREVQQKLDTVRYDF
jgi:hypothetical protein